MTNSFDYDDDDDEDDCKVTGRYDQAATQILLPRCLSKWSSTSPASSVEFKFVRNDNRVFRIEQKKETKIKLFT